MILNLYLVERPDRPGWDEFDSFVVAAATVEEARQTRPGSYGGWARDIATLKVTLVGVAVADVKPGIVLASFNAG